MRVCCRAGRLQRDQLLSQLRLRLGRSAVTGGDGAQLRRPPSPSPPQLLASLSAVVARGARLRRLEVSFEDRHDEWREAQL